MVKICAISDTHNKHKDILIPECDILIHCGDFTGRGAERETAAFTYWLSTLEQAKHKIFIAGNHDFLAQKDQREFLWYVSPNLIYLQDTWVKIEGLKIYGTPWTPFFFDWAFNGIEERDGRLDYEGGPGKFTKPDYRHPYLKDVYSNIPEDIDILVCHGPPALGNIHITKEGNKTGSEELLKKSRSIPTLKYGFCGHIHEGYGKAEDSGVVWYNVSTLDRDYNVANPPVIVEV